MIEVEVAEMLPINEALGVIKTMNDDEKIETKDELPTHEQVWKTITGDEKRAADEPNIEYHNSPTLTPEQMDNATVTKITTPGGEEVDVIVVNKAGIEVTKGASLPEDNLEELAKEIADEVIDEVEDEIVEPAKPDPVSESESESEEEEPKPVKEEPKPVKEEPKPV